MPYNPSDQNRVGSDFDFNPGGGTQVRFGEADYAEGTDMWATQVRVRDQFAHGWRSPQGQTSQKVWRGPLGWYANTPADLDVVQSDRALVVTELQAGSHSLLSPHSLGITPGDYASFQMRFRQTVAPVGGSIGWNGAVYWKDTVYGTGSFASGDKFQYTEPAGLSAGEWCDVHHVFTGLDSWFYPVFTPFVDQLRLDFHVYYSPPSSYAQYEIAWIALDTSASPVADRITSALWDRTAYPAGAIELYDSSLVELGELPQNPSNLEDNRWMDRIVSGWTSGSNNILTYITDISPDESRYLFGQPHVSVPKDSPVGEFEDTSMPLSVRVHSTEQASPPNLVLRARTPGIGTANEPSVYVYAKAEKASYEFKFGYLTHGDDPQWDGVTGTPRNPEDLLSVGMQIGLQYSLEPGGICYGIITSIGREIHTLPSPYNVSIGGSSGIITCRWLEGVTPQQAGITGNTGTYHWPRYFDVGDTGDYFEPTVDTYPAGNSDTVRGQFVLRGEPAPYERNRFINIDPLLGSGSTWELFSTLQELTPLGNSARVLYAPTGTSVDFGFQKLLVSWEASHYKHWIDVNDS